MPNNLADSLSVASITAIAAGGAILIASFFAGLVSVITAWRTIAGKVSAIEGHVNSEKTASDGREALLRRENELLQDMLAEKKVTAALLAQSAAGLPPVMAITPPESSPSKKKETK